MRAGDSRGRSSSLLLAVLRVDGVARRALRAAHVGADDAGACEIPIGAVYLAMPVGFALLIVHLLLMARPTCAPATFLADDEFDADAVEAVIATLFIGCIVLLALGVPVAFALGGGDARRDRRHGDAAARSRCRSTCSAASTCSR